MLRAGVVIDERRGIHQDAVDFAGQRRLGKPGTNARGNIRYGNRTIKVFLASVRKRNYGHGLILPKGIYKDGAR